MFYKDYGNGNENPIAFQLQGQKLIYLSVYIVPYLDLPWLWSHRQSIPQKAHSSALSCLRTTGAERRKWMENEGLAFILFLPTEWGQLHVKVIGRAEQAFPLYSFHITLNFHIMDLKQSISSADNLFELNTTFGKMKHEFSRVFQAPC